MTQKHPHPKATLLALLISSALGYATPSLVNAQMGEMPTMAELAAMRAMAVQQSASAHADSLITGVVNGMEQEPHGDYLSSLPCIFCSADKTDKKTDNSAEKDAP